jgi:hypothetical protein
METRKTSGHPAEVWVATKEYLDLVRKPFAATNTTEHDQRGLPQTSVVFGLATWGEQAEALCWSSSDLFGLHTPPENPRPSYRRLSRYDETGLTWFLEGCEVLAVTATTATIRRPSGSTTIYRKKNTPAPSAQYPAKVGKAATFHRWGYIP